MLGALALHVVMVACGSAPPSTPGDAGVLADVRDAIVDALQDVIDAETPDAHAGGDGGVPPADGGVTPDGGVPTCNCVPPQPTYRFSGGAVSFAGGASGAAADFSTVDFTATPIRTSGGGLAVSFSVTVSYYANNGTAINVLCYVTANPDGTIRPQTGGSTALCRATYENETDGLRGASTEGSAPVGMMGAMIRSLTASTVSIQLPLFNIPLRRIVGGAPSDPAMVFPITVEASVPGAQWLTPPRALRP